HALLLRYICQYIVVRQSTRGESIRWLIVHFVLALFRVGIWIWDPKFDNFTHFNLKNDNPFWYSNGFNLDSLAWIHFSTMKPGRLRIPVVIGDNLGSLNLYDELLAMCDLLKEDQPLSLR